MQGHAQRSALHRILHRFFFGAGLRPPLDDDRPPRLRLLPRLLLPLPLPLLLLLLLLPDELSCRRRAAFTSAAPFASRASVRSAAACLSSAS